MNRARRPVSIVPKGWGREIWIVNGDLYCGKILEIRKGKRCSLHFHKLKTESFYLRAGRLRVRVKESPESEVMEEFELAAGECMDIPLGLYIKWKRWRMPSCTSSPRNTSTATRIASYPATEADGSETASRRMALLYSQEAETLDQRAEQLVATAAPSVTAQLSQRVRIFTPGGGTTNCDYIGTNGTIAAQIVLAQLVAVPAK